MTISRTSSTLCSSKCAKHAAVIQSQLLMLLMLLVHVEGAHRSRCGGDLT